MPIRKAWLPREGFVSEPVFKWIGNTVLNPALLLPIVLLARFTKKGEDLSILHPLALSRVKTLLYIGLAKWLSNKASDGVMNSWEKDTYDWPNEVAVVTGGAGGIGSHVVKLLEEKGMKVVVLDIIPMTAEVGPNVFYYKCDLTRRAQVLETAERIRKEVGNPTILINNAGVARGKSVLDTTERDLKFTYDVNTFAHFYTAQAFLPYMVKQNHGMVVTVASYASFLSVPNLVDYAGSKAAALAFHEGLTAELKTVYNAPKVRTVIVNQGHVHTPLFAGHTNDSSFLVPTSQPETIADAICEQVFTGRSGHVVYPSFGQVLQLLRGFPRWMTYRMRNQQKSLMQNFAGRQVVKDLDSHYAGRDDASTTGSTVIVPEQKA